MHKNIELYNEQTQTHEIWEVETESEFNNLFRYPYIGNGKNFNDYEWTND